MQISDLMGTEGPCFHCVKEQTVLWRPGPLEKQNLCNACGSRWRTKGTLADYVPKPGITQSKHNSLFDENKTRPVEVDTDNEFGLGSRKSSLSECTEIKIPAAKAKVRGFPLSIKVPRRKKLVFPEYRQTHIRRLHRQLLDTLHEQQSAAKTSASGEEGNDLLVIDNTSWMTSSNETALGAVLLK